MIKNVLKNINANKFGSSIFAISMFISIFCLSIGINMFLNQKNYTSEYNEFADKNINVDLTFESKIDYKSMSSLWAQLSENKYTVFLPRVQMDLDEKRAFITGLISKDAKFNLVRGRNFSQDELSSQCKKIIIGANYTDKVYLKDEKEFINIFDEEYEVIGVVGKKYSSSFYDFNMYIPYKGVPEHIKNTKSDFVEVQVDNKNIEIKEDLIEAYGITTTDIQPINQITLNSKLKNFKDYFDYLKHMSIFVLISMFLLIMSWINSRKYQIVIKKVVGYTSFKIIQELILEMSIITIISSIVTSVFYKIVSGYLEDFFYIKIYSSPINFVISTCIALVISIFIALCQIFIISKSNMNSLIQS